MKVDLDVQTYRELSLNSLTIDATLEKKNWSVFTWK